MECGFELTQVAEPYPAGEYGKSRLGQESLLLVETFSSRVERYRKFTVHEAVFRHRLQENLFFSKGLSSGIEDRSQLIDQLFIQAVVHTD